MRHDGKSWLTRETPVPNWTLIGFFILTINGIIDLVRLI